MLDNETALLRLRTRSRSIFSSTVMEYYLTDSRVIATKSNLSSNRLRDISLDQVVSVDEKEDTVLLQYITGALLVLMGVIMVPVVGGSASGILGGLLILFGLSAIIFGYFNKSTGYIIKTPNPDVSMELNVARNSPKTRKFIDRVRKEARRK